jgi:flagellar biosynthesis component FlhA
MIEPVWQLPGVWAESTEDGNDGVSAFSCITIHLEAVILQNYSLIINRQTVADLVGLVKAKYPAVVDGFIPEKISYSYLQQIFIGLLQKRYAINNLVRIIELIEDHQSIYPEVGQMVDFIAEQLGNDYIMKDVYLN